MTISSQLFDLEYAPKTSTCTELIFEVQRGLLTRPRSLASWMFYDELGLALFERITALPEYYPTRTESSILASHADAIIAQACADQSRPLRIVELGAGTASKTAVLLEAAERMQVEVLYMPVDVSVVALNVACQSIGRLFPKVNTEPVIVNYVTCPLQLEEFDGITLVLYLGSSIGNFSPEESRAILRSLGNQLQASDAFVLGTDMAKDESILLAAYDDSERITAAFNLNILYRLNRELGANFNLNSFRHHVLWNRSKSRIEMHLESTRQQMVYVPAAELGLDFEKGETIHTEDSYKFTNASIGTLMCDSGFEIEKMWKDELGWYAVTLARPHEFENYI